MQNFRGGITTIGKDRDETRNVFSNTLLVEEQCGHPDDSISFNSNQLLLTEQLVNARYGNVKKLGNFGERKDAIRSV